MAIKEEFNTISKQAAKATGRNKQDLMNALNELIEAYPDECAAAFEESLAALEVKARSVFVKQHVAPLSEILSMKYVAVHYFKKSNGWLHQRINGNTINGKVATFTDNDMKIMKHALQDIAAKIMSVADSI